MECRRNNMTKSRTKHAINNMFMGFLNQFISLILSFISRTIFIRILGVELLGVNGLFTDILSLLSMADLGFNTAMVFSFYKPIADNDTKKISALVNFYKHVYMTIAATITLIGIAIVPFLNVIINTDKQIPLLSLYYLFSLAGVVISYLFVYKTSIITASQQNYIISKINIIINFVKTILQILSIILFKNYIIYLMINLISNYLNNYIASKKAEQLYPYINEVYDLDKEDKKSIYNNIKSIFLYKISGLLLNATDNMIISIIMGTITVGYYSNYLMITNKVVAIIQIVFGALTASIGNLIIVEKCNKRYEIFKASQSISFIICGIIVTCFSILINDLINIWLGNKFVLDDSVVLAISLNMYLACVLQPLWTYREAAGLYVRTRYIMMIAAIINLILSIILGKVMGLSGVLLASAISRITTYFWYEPMILFKEYFSQSVWKYYSPILINILLTVITTIVFNHIFTLFVVKSWFELFTKSILCVFPITILFLLIYSKSEGFKIIINKVKNIYMTLN